MLKTILIKMIVFRLKDNRFFGLSVDAAQATVQPGERARGDSPCLAWEVVGKDGVSKKEWGWQERITAN